MQKIRELWLVADYSSHFRLECLPYKKRCKDYVVFTFPFIYVKMLSYQKHFNELYVGTIEKKLVDKQKPWTECCFTQ